VGLVVFVGFWGVFRFSVGFCGVWGWYNILFCCGVLIFVVLSVLGLLLFVT